MYTGLCTKSVDKITLARERPLCDTGRPLATTCLRMGTTASEKRSAGAVTLRANVDVDASAPGTPSMEEPAEPLERARLQAEVARQRVRIAKEELKRARKRMKEAKREAKRARKQADETRKAWKKARKAHRANAAPASSTGTAPPRTPQAKSLEGATPSPAKRGKKPRRRRPARPAPESQADSGAPATPSSET